MQTQGAVGALLFCPKRPRQTRSGRISRMNFSPVEALASRIVEKLLHLPTVRMKQAAAAADGVVYAETVRHLFGLEDKS